MHVSPVFPVESVAIANAQENMIRMTDDETIQKIIVE